MNTLTLWVATLLRQKTQQYKSVHVWADSGKPLPGLPFIAFGLPPGVLPNFSRQLCSKIIKCPVPTIGLLRSPPPVSRQCANFLIVPTVR